MISSRVTAGPCLPVNEVRNGQALVVVAPPLFQPAASVRASSESGMGDGWTVRSHVPGRIRLHHPMIAAHISFFNAIERRLTRLDGANWFKISRITGTVLIEYAAGLLTGREIIRQLTEAILQAVDESEETSVPIAPAVEATTVRLMMSSVALGLSAGSLLLPVLRPLATAATALAGSHIVISAARSLAVERRLRVDVLDATVITVALAYKKVLAAGFLIWAVDLSEALLASSSLTQRRNLTELFGRQARHAWRLEDGVEFDRTVTELQVGDVIVVHAGEQIPVDGEILCGEASLDRSSLTGEHAAIECLAGERVFAMSVLLTGSLHVVVQKTGADTTAARMVQIVEEALDHKPKLQTRAERFAERMVTPTLGLGGMAYGIAGPGPMLAVINADFGTGIRVAGPLAMLASLSAAAKNGILIKKGQVLEDLGNMNAVVFDKTGTLTEDVPTVGRILTLSGEHEQNDLLVFAAAAERRFSHPIAKAIVTEAAARGLTVPETEASGYEVGLGVRVQIDQRVFAIGSLRFIVQSGVEMTSDATAFAEEIHRAGGTAIFIACDRTVLGVIELTAVARQEAAGLVRYLRETKGIEEIHLLSGDHDAPVRMLARQLGIDHYQAAMLPQQKAEYVRNMQSRGLRVAMFGDGVNDTAGLAQANYSISLRGASDVATDVADVVFLDGNLAKFPLLDRISANLASNVKRSVALTLVPNTVCIAGAMFGVFGLGSSLLFNNVGNLVTVINGSRAQSGLGAARMDIAVQPAA
jgi:heavy metal translocating P-type ATPase